MKLSSNASVRIGSGRAKALPELVNRVMRAMLCNARQCWEQGIAAYAMAEMEERELLIAMCHDIIIRQNADGRLCDVENAPTITDPAICIAPVLRAGAITGEACFTTAAERNIRYLLEDAPRSMDGVLYHIVDTTEIWADSAAMTPAVLVHAGLHDFGIQQMDGICHRLKKSNGLYAHKWDEKENCLLRANAWAAGNGWIAVGLAWLILELGTDDPQTERMLQRFRALMEAMEIYRTPDGLFHNVVDDPKSFVDCEAAAMTAYAAALLVESGWLPTETIASAKQVYHTLCHHVDEYGYVRDCAGSPGFEEPGTSTETQAFFLMLYAVLQRMDLEN